MHPASSLRSHLGLSMPSMSRAQVRKLCSTKHPCFRSCPPISAIAEPLASVDDYNARMAEKMGWTTLDNPYEYRPERGKIYLHLLSSPSHRSLKIYFN
jgi:hypothetical protein